MRSPLEKIVMDAKSSETRKRLEAAGIIGLIASLIFVALEIRQNTIAVRGATIQGFAEHSMEISLFIGGNPDVRAAYLARNDADLTEDQDLILGTMYTAVMRLLENRFIHAEIGVIDYEDLNRFGIRSGTLRTPYFHRYWERVKTQYSPQFQEYVEREILSQSIVPSRRERSDQ